MSIYRDARSGRWVVDFWFQGTRHRLPGLELKADAEEAEANLKRTLRRRAAGLEALDAADTPSFSNWAAVTLKFQTVRKKLKRPDEAKKTLRMILGFWGARPKTKPISNAPYKDLRLGDPIRDPSLIHEFEDWMVSRNLSGTRKNHYRSACSMLYRVALQPENRTRAGVRENPFLGIMRDRVNRRTPVIDAAAIVTWLEVAPLPAVVAVALGSLAPALRFASVVELRRDQLSPERDYLTVPHKADRETGLPLTVSISTGLRRVIVEVERLYPNDPYVVPIVAARSRRKGNPPGRYWPLWHLVKESITTAGLTGVTFHSLRHAMQTFMARQGLSSDERQRAMGHATSAMASWYTHLGGQDTVRAMELIAGLPIADAAIARLKATEAVQSPRQVPSTKMRPADKSPRGGRKSQHIA